MHSFSASQTCVIIFKYIIKDLLKKEENKNRKKFRSSFILVKFSRLQTPATISEKEKTEEP